MKNWEVGNFKGCAVSHSLMVTGIQFTFRVHDEGASLG